MRSRSGEVRSPLRCIKLLLGVHTLSVMVRILVISSIFRLRNVSGKMIFHTWSSTGCRGPLITNFKLF